MSSINNPPPPPTSVSVNIDINDVMPPPTTENKGDIVTLNNPQSQDADDVQQSNQPDDANTSSGTTINITLTAGASTENINIQIYQTATPNNPVPPPDPGMVAATHDYIQGTGAQYVGGSGGGGSGSGDSNVNNQGQGSGGQGGETGGASGAGATGGIMGYSGIMGRGGAGGGGGGGTGGGGTGSGGSGSGSTGGGTTTQGTGSGTTAGVSGSSSVTSATGTEGPQGIIGVKSGDPADEEIRTNLKSAIDNWFASNPQTAFNMTYSQVVKSVMANEAVMNVVAQIATLTTERLANEEMNQAEALGRDNQQKDLWQASAAAIGMAVTGFCCIMSTRAMGKEESVPEESDGEFTAAKTGNPTEDTVAMKAQNSANDQVREFDNETSGMQKNVRDREQTIASKTRENERLNEDSATQKTGESNDDFQARIAKNDAKKAENSKQITDMKAENAQDEKVIIQRTGKARANKIAALKQQAKANGADLEDTKSFQARKAAVMKKNAYYAKQNMMFQTLSQMGGNLSQLITGLGTAHLDLEIGQTQAQQARLQGASKVNDTLASLASQGIQADESMIQAFLQGRATLSQTMAQYMGALYKFS